MNGLRSVRGVIYGTAILFLVATVGFRAIALWENYRQSIARAEDTTRDVTAIVAENARRTFETSDLVVDQALAIVAAAGGLDAARGNYDVHRRLALLSQKLPTSGNIWIVDPSGRPFLMSDRFPAISIDLSDRTWFKMHQEGQERYVGEALIGRINEEPLFTFSRSVLGPEGRPRAIILVSLRPTFFNGNAFSPEYRKGGVLGMYQTDGDVIARSPFRPDMLGTGIRETALFARFISMKSGTHRGVSAVDGQDRIVSFTNLGDWPVVVAASIAVDDALAGWSDQVIWSAALLAAILTALGWLVWLGLTLSQAEEKARTSLARAVADRDVLFQEIHHRIKNNLATVASLLALQARKLSSPEAKAALEETRERVSSISLVHETLYQTGHADEVDLAQYLTRLVNGLADAYGASARGITVRTDMSHCTIDLQRAIPIALTINEAVTNAFKHAFPDGDRGEICVGVECHGDGYLFSVEDTGRGVPAAASGSTSLGMRLIQSFAGQVNGRFSLQNSGRTVFSLEVPKSAAA